MENKMTGKGGKDTHWTEKCI